MLLKILQKDFAKLLNNATRFTASRAQLPILANILLKAEKASLKVMATNLEMSISASVGVKIETGGEITVPARTIAEIVQNLKSETITLQSEKETLKIATENFSAELTGLNSSEFPEIPQKVTGESVTVPKNKFFISLANVLFAVSSDDTRPILTGVLFVFGDDGLFLVSSDGFRLSRKKVLGKTSIKQSFIIPKGVLNELPKIFTSSEANFSLAYHQKDGQVIFGGDSAILSSRLINGDYPDFEKIIPKASETVVRVDKEDFSRAIKISSVFARDSANTVKLEVKEDSLIISAESSKSGSQKSIVDAKIEGKPVVISYNFRFIEEFLGSIDDEEVVIGLTDGTSPGVFKSPKDPDFLHLIMPVRI